MNKYRLSSSGVPRIDSNILKADISKLLNVPSNYLNKKGKVRIISLGRYKTDTLTKPVQ